MGCFSSKQDDYEDYVAAIEQGGRIGRTKHYKKPVWQSDEPITKAQLQRLREEFWDTQPHYGGDRVIWDALRAACEADMATAKLIIESAGIIVSAHNMTVCYDERGAKYDLPLYVLSDPTNLAAE